MRARYPLFLAVLATLSCLLAQPPNWSAAGDRALYDGRPAEAAEDYRQALDVKVRAGVPEDALQHLRVNLATAYMEAGDIHAAEGLLRQAHEAGTGIEAVRSRAELLNTWSAVHTFQGKWNDAERELGEARRIMLNVPQTGDLLPSVLHNLAAIEIRTGAYAEALNNEKDALSLWGKVLNADHPHFVKGWAGLGAVQFLLGRPREAHQSMERAITSARKTYGPEHSMVASLLESDALILDKLKRRQQAKLAWREARRIRGSHPAAELGRTTWNIREGLAPDSSVYLSAK